MYQPLAVVCPSKLYNNYVLLTITIINFYPFRISFVKYWLSFSRTSLAFLYKTGCLYFSLLRKARAQGDFLESRNKPISRNKIPCKIGKKSPAIPRMINPHPNMTYKISLICFFIYYVTCFFACYIGP